MIYEYFVTYIVNDKMDKKNFPNFSSLFHFIIDLAKSNNEIEIIVQNNKGQAIAKYTNIKKED